METEKVKKEWTASRLNNATAIRNTKYKPEYGKQKVFSCGGGLCFVVKPASRSWLLRSYFDNKPITLSFGDYELVDYAKAKELQIEAKKKIKEGIDPRLKKEDVVKELTFEDAYDYYLINKKMTENVRFKLKQAFNKHILQNEIFKDKPLNSITSRDIMDWLHEREETQIKAGYSTYQIGRIYNKLINVFEYAVVAGYMEKIPAVRIAIEHIDRHVEKHFLCFDFSELPTFYQRLSDYRSSKITKLMLNFLALTAMRSGEIRNMEWSWINFDENHILIPNDKHKTGIALLNKGKEADPWYIFLSRQSKQILEVAREITGDYKYVFPSPVNFNNIASNAIFTDALERLEYKGIHHPHGFRSLYKTKMYSLDKNNEEYLELNLIHQPDLTKTAKHYTHKAYLMFHSERAELMQQWADILDTQKLNII